MKRLTTVLLLLLSLSAWAQVLCINVGMPDDWQTGMYFNDMARQARPWGTIEDPYGDADHGKGVPYAQYRPDGYPRGDFAGCLASKDRPSGTWTYSFKGKGKITFADGCRNQTATTVDIDGNGGIVVWKVTGTDPSDPFRDLHIYPPGVSAADGTWSKRFRDSLAPARVLRVMDMMRPNYEQPDNPPTYETRSLPGQLQTRLDKGVSLEYLCELATATGKDIWVTVPYGASADYHRKAAALMKQLLPPTTIVYVEVSNEVWNFQFPQAKALFAKAQNDPRCPGPNEYQKLFQLQGQLARDVGIIYRQEIGTDRVRPIFAGQGVVPWFVDMGCDNIENKFGKGECARSFFAISYADYYPPEWTVERQVPAPTVIQLAGSMRKYNVGTDDKGGGLKMIRDHVALAKKYGVNRVFTYEGGPAVSDTVINPDTGERWVGNHEQHEALQYSPLLGSLMVDAYTQFGREGGYGYSLFCGPVGNWLTGEYGYWPLQPTSDKWTPKTYAFWAMAKLTPPVLPDQPPPVDPPPVVVVPPATQPTTQPTTNPTTRPIVVKAVTITTPGVTTRYEATGQQTITVEQK